MLCVHGYIHALRRVQGDDGDDNQVLRWLIMDKQEKHWDVFRVHESGKQMQYYSRQIVDGQNNLPKFNDMVKDPMLKWKECFNTCKPSASAA